MRLSAVLLFIVLFYVYTLKFLFVLVVDQLLGYDTAVPAGPRLARRTRARRVREIEDTRGDTGLPAGDGSRTDLHGSRRPRRGESGLLGGVRLPAALPGAEDQQLPDGLTQEEKPARLLEHLVVGDAGVEPATPFL